MGSPSFQRPDRRLRLIAFFHRRKVGNPAHWERFRNFCACLIFRSAVRVAIFAVATAGANDARSAEAPSVVGEAEIERSVEFRSLAYGGRNLALRLEDSDPALAQPSSDEARVHRYAAIGLTHHGRTLGVSFGPPSDTSRLATRLHYKLEGYDAEWRDLTNTSMHLVLKFLDANRIPVSREEFLITGESVGWTGEMAKSTLSIRKGRCVVPPRAAWVAVWVDSGGHDETSGVWLIDDLKISETKPQEAASTVLLQEDFEQGAGLDQQQGDFSRWVRDGGALDGALVWSGAPARGDHALLIMDSNPRDYAAWRFKDNQLLPVVPGRQLDLQWSELFSIGAGRNGDVSYSDLPSGQYQFRVREVDAVGTPTGEEAILPLIIAPPFYHNLWFQTALLLSLVAAGLGLERIAARRGMHRKLEKLRHAQAVQQERARIARDIHDDLGTVLSRISMVSEAAAIEAEPGSLQEQRLAEICETSRQLTRTMEEIVWAQDPKHDSLDNTVSYFCSFASDLLGVARIACRLNIPIDLPDIPLEAEQRHELFLVFKEALNNIIKHSGASEVRISLSIENETIHLVVEDNGRGFDSAKLPDSRGNGLANMKNRLQRINGMVEVRSATGKGTTVEIFQPIRNEFKNQ